MSLNESDSRRRGGRGPLSNLGQWFLKYLIGYGYHSIRALLWLVLLFGLTSVFALTLLGRHGLITTVPPAAATPATQTPAPKSGSGTTTQATSVHCSAIGQVSYAVELGFPIINLNSGSPGQCAVSTTNPRWWVVGPEWLIRALAAALFVVYGPSLSGVTRTA